MPTKYVRQGFREHLEEHRHYVGTLTPGGVETPFTRRHVHRLMLVSLMLLILFAALGPRLGGAFRRTLGAPTSHAAGVVFLKHMDASDPTAVRYFLGVNLEVGKGRVVPQIVATDKEGWETVAEGSRVRVIYTVDEANRIEVREIYAEKAKR